MNNVRDDLTIYEVLGQTYKLKKDESLNGILPSEVVGYVQTKIQDILKKSPNLNETQIATLVALNIAGEKLFLEKEYRENVAFFKAAASDSVRIIDEMSFAAK